MSLITRCPACQTMFRVVPDQLRISDGWVRCGQCEEIFDASLNLLPTQPADAPVAPRFEPVQEPVIELRPAQDDVEVEHSAGHVDLSELPSDSSSSDDTEFLELTVASQETPDQWTQPLRESEALEPAEDGVEISGSQAPDLVAATNPSPVNVGVPDAELTEPPVSFLKNENGHAFWGHASVRWAMGLLLLVLLLGLALQVLVHERNRIVALQPTTKPWMQVLCDTLDCTLSPLRKIDSIVIESSSFARVRGESHRLSFVLKNTSDLPLAIPSMELTLTDAQDQVVTRRVLAPSELGATARVLPAGAEWSGAADFAVDTGSKAERVAGYRLLAFYP